MTEWPSGPESTNTAGFFVCRITLILDYRGILNQIRQTVNKDMLDYITWDQYKYLLIDKQYEANV